MKKPTKKASSKAKTNVLETRARTQAMPGKSEMARLMRKFDWESTKLGPVSEWPESLKAVVRILLTSRFAMWMGWGPDLAFFYNDAYRAVTLGKKHPWALGKPSSKVWEEIWTDIEPRIRKVLKTGEATWDEALLLFLERSGYTEETYHTFSYSPVIGDDGKINGNFCVVVEETERVIGERRISTLRALSAELVHAATEKDVAKAIVRALEQNQNDLPFTITYLFSADGTEARLACSSGIKAGHAAAPQTIRVDDKKETWPIRELLKKQASVVVSDLKKCFVSLPTGAWQKPPERAVLVPIPSQVKGALAGVMVAASNPFRPLDTDYTGFLNLLAGQIAGSIGNARAYDAERQRAETLAELDRAKTAFFTNVSHEFRTPLTLILGPTEGALHSVGNLSGAELETVHRNSLRLLKLVNSLLDFSRIEAGRVRANYERTDLCTVTSELASVFRSAIERAGIRFDVDCKPLAKPVYVDREMWEKIVLNLLSNAFKFTLHGEIGVKVRSVAGRAELQIRDTGAGIPEEELPRMFERFHRVQGTEGRTQEGTGIGLALVQELLKLHGGDVAVESKLGKGSTFTVTLPFGSSHLPAHLVVESQARRLSGAAPYVAEALRWLPGASQAESTMVGQAAADDSVPFPATAKNGEKLFRVLLADDNRDMREYVAGLLRQKYEVTAAEDGRAALESAQENPPDLVLTDVMMPRMDGFQLLKALRDDARTASVPVIMLSARAGEEARVEGLETGADDYLTKPFTARELMARVGSHLAMAEIRRKAEVQERKLRDLAETEHRRLMELIERAPAAIAVTSGPEHRWSLMNENYLKVIGRESTAALLGKPIRQTLPELIGQGFFELLDDVYRTGEPFVGTETRAKLNRGPLGQEEIAYFNFIYQPLKNVEGQTEGVLVHAIEVTEQVLSRRTIERSDAAMRLVQQAAKIGSWEFSVETDEWSLSEEAALMLGRSGKGKVSLSQFLSSMSYSGDRDNFAAALNRTVRRNQDFEAQIRVVHGADVSLMTMRGKMFYNQGAPVLIGLVIDTNAVQAPGEMRGAVSEAAKTAKDPVVREQTALAK